MLKELQIYNFQCWENVTIEFHPGVNVIVGLTNAGKSAIFRALFWTLYNRPLGDEFKSDWAEETLVQTTFTNLSDSATEIFIERQKGKENTYFLNGHIFRAFGQNPPEEILKAHNLDRNLNIQSQIDPFFLLQSSPGDVARYLNQIAKLDDIDSVKKALDRHNSKAEQNIKTGQSYTEQLEEELKRFDGIEEIGEAIDQAEQLSNEIQQKETLQTNLTKTISSINQTERNIHHIQRRLQIKPLVEKSLEIKTQIQAKKDVQRRLNISLRQIKDISEIIKNLQDGIEDNKKLFNRHMSETCPLCGHEIEGKIV